MWTFPTFVLADTLVPGELLKICPGPYGPTEASGSAPSEPTKAADRDRDIQSKQDSLNDALGYVGDGSTCGEPNAVTGFLEKGDCSAAGYVITELSEPIGNPVAITEGEDAGNKIINVYKGTCCWYADWNEEGQQECYETREIYAESISECDAGASFCSQRQWVIGSSGAGIIKLYVKQIYTFMAFTVGAIAVSTMVIAGIQISVSGVSGDISAAKQRMTQAITGIVLLFFSGILLYTINPTFFT
jgi:hypothetical protein